MPNTVIQSRLQQPIMIMKKVKILASLAILAAFSACSSPESSESSSSVDSTTVSPVANLTPLVEEVLTQAERDALTPDQIIAEFKAGNVRFMNNDLTLRDHSAQVRKAALGQFPKAIVLSCLDSRVPVEEIFDRGIGSIFVGRVAGNFVNEDLLGSMEFGTKVAGAKVILVLGHEYCGAVMSAIDDVKLGNITAMLSKIKPAVALVEYEGDRTSANAEFVSKVAQSNVIHTMDQIRKNSPILKELEDNGQLKIVGGVYDMETGKVTFLE